jgi:predicted phage tail protein
VRTAQARFEQDVLLSKKDAESDRRLADLQVKTLEETVKHQASQIDTLEKQLAEAKQQVQDIAVKAIEGASGARALSHVNQIAMEQAKQRNPQA